METEVDQLVGCVENIQKYIFSCPAKQGNSEEQNSGTFLINVYPEWENIEQPIEMKEIAFDNITSLSLTNCKLKYFPSAFKNCKSLVELDISHNNLRYVPDLVLYSNSSNGLKTLNMSFNLISNFSTAPKCCLTLQYLDLSNNQLSEIPAWILNADCYKLEMLNLSVNCIQKLEPMNGRGFRKLSDLLLNSSQIKSNILNFVYKQPNLQKLHLSNTEIKFFNTVQQFRFKDFVSAPVLIELQFSNLGYSEIPEEITLLKSLQILNLSENCISWLPKNFEEMESLQILDLSYNELLELPENIGELSNLKEFHLSFNLLGSLPESISNMNSLEIVDCYHNDMMINSVERVLEIQSLIGTDFEQNCFATNDTVLSNYDKKREAFRVLFKIDRLNGKKIEKEEFSWDKSDLNGEEYDNHISYNKTNIKELSSNKTEEENWDCDDEDAIYNDDFLALPPYRRNIQKKNTPACSQSTIHPIFFEDALEDY